MQDDTISRKIVLDKIKEVCFSNKWIKYRVNYGSKWIRDYLIDFIERMPSVQPEQKVGKWAGFDEYPQEDWECNCCGKIVITGCSDVNPYDEYKYCPNCGAKMEGDN